MFLSLKKIKSIIIRAVLGIVFLAVVVFFGMEVHANNWI